MKRFACRPDFIAESIADLTKEEFLQGILEEDDAPKPASRRPKEHASIVWAGG